MGFFGFGGGSEKPQERSVGRGDLGLGKQGVPDAPNVDNTEAANMTPEMIQGLIEEELASSNPDNGRIAHLERLLENKRVN